MPRPRCSLAERAGRASAGVLVLVCSLLVALASGCGGGDAKGAEVTVYVGASICPGAKSELANHAGKAGSFKVRAVCLPATEAPASAGTPARTDLATAGANARRATEDTSAVALVEPPGQASKFTHPILETAGIPLVTSPSGKAAMARTLEAIEKAGSSSVRDGVREALEPS
jgi:hypothetical protein